MAIIGTLTPTRDGGWIGPVFIMAHEVRIKLAPNDNKANPKAPAFRVFAGTADLGAMWQKKTNEEQPHDFLSGEVDYPGLEKPISVAVFFSEDGKKAQAVWRREA